MSDSPVVAYAPIPETSDYIEPPAAGYTDKLIQARLAGHGWEDVDRFISTGSTAALAEGYTQREIDDHLGLTDPHFRMAADARNRLSSDEAFAAAIKQNATEGLLVTPLEEASAGRMQGYASWVEPPAAGMPADDKPLEPSGIDLHDEHMRNSYARSLFDDAVRSPRDFAERYAGGLAMASDLDPGAAIRAAGEIASKLPSDRDFTDQAIAIAHSSGLSITPYHPPEPEENLQKNQQFMKDGVNPSDFETKLSPDDETKFRQWVKDKNVPFDPDEGGPSDYDMRGFYRGLMNGDEHAQTGMNANDGQLHFSDWWKTPYHESFSTESQWADTSKAPKWNDQDQLVTPGGQVVFDERNRPEDTVKIVRNNLIDHWAATGADLMDVYRKAETDPGFAATLTTEKKPAPSMLEQFAAAEMAEVERSQDIGGWITDRLKDWYSWRMSQPDATQEGWDKHVEEAHEFLKTGKLSEEDLSTALGFAGGNIENVGAKFGEAIGLLKPVEPMVKLLDPAAEGGAGGQIPFSELFSEKARTVVDTLSNAAGRIGDVAIDLKDRFYNKVAAQLGDSIHVGGEQPGIKPIEAWHASPHDFDRFDPSKLGTGEGNAGHGAGMYFAENPKVHDYYKKQFTTEYPEGFDINHLSEESRALVQDEQLGLSLKDLHETLKDDILPGMREFEERVATGEVNPDMVVEGGHNIPAVEKDIDYLSKFNLENVISRPANSYKVNLHVDPDKLFHLDKPISQQGEHVQAAVAKLAEEHGLGPTTDAEIPWGNLTGREFYDELKEHFGGDTEGELSASSALQKAGFDGTKYLDGFSRARGEAESEMAHLRGRIEQHKNDIELLKERGLDENSNQVKERQASIKYNETAIEDIRDRLKKPPTHNYVIFDDAKMDIREKNGTPITAADVQRQVEAVAQGQEAAHGMFDFVKQLGLDILKDESGGLNIFRTPEQQAKRASYTDSRDFMRPLIIQQRSQGEQVVSHFYDQADHWKTVAGKTENLFKLLEPHMKEFTGELAKGINGNPMNTMVGNLIQYVEGKSMGAAMRHDNPLTPVADGIRYINQEVRSMLEDGFRRGIINQNSYFEDYFRHMWKDPNKASRAFEEFQSRVGKLGSSSGLMQRSLPTFEDGIKMGLEPAIANPLELTLFDAAQKIKYLKSAEILEFARTTRNPLTGDKYVNWRVGPQGNEVPLGSHRTTKGIPNDPQGRDLQAYADPGLANTWNDWLSKGFHERPGVTSSLYDKMLYTFNTMSGLSLAVPSFHAMTEIMEAWTGGISHALAAASSGRVLEAGKELALSIPPISTVRGVAGGASILKEYNSRFITNPALQALVDAGARFGPRQEIYKMGAATPYSVAIRRGQLISEWRDEITGVFGNAKEPLDYRIAHAPFRAFGVAAHETGRLLNAVSAPLFDYAIPRLKAYNNVRQMDLYLRSNPLATPEQIAKRANQIVRNTDERLGEMNMDNVFWKKGVKQTAQLGMISLGWVYGWARLLTSAAGLNIEKMAFEANPVAVRSLVGFTMAYAMESAVYQYLKTGQLPFTTDTPIHDLLAPRTGGKDQYGAPERALLPSQAKELVDFYKIGAYAAHDPMLGLQQLHEYARGKGKVPVQLLLGLATGVDAIGNDIAHTAGGWTGFIEDAFKPIFLSALDDRKKGTEISPEETMMGIHPMTKAAQNPQAFYEGLYKQDRRLYKQQQNRAKHENKIYINPREIPVDPETENGHPAGPSFGHGPSSREHKAFSDFMKNRGH